jgi:L-asparaginase II
VTPAICEVRRGGRVESVHRVSVAAWEGGKVRLAWGDVRTPVYMRSSAKPFQAYGVVACGAADAYGLAAPELSILCGSHGGEPEQVRAAAAILRKARLGPDALRCGTHPPSSPRALRALQASRREPTVLHNNCSGKHAGMVAAAKHLGAPLATYLDPRHPVQRRNLETVAAFSSVAARRIPLGVDGCSAPTFALPLAAMARMIAGFCGDDPVARRLREAMMSHPSMVGRPCAQIMAAAPGRLLGKVGAEGVYVLAAVERRAGLALKVEDGNFRAIVPVLCAALRKLGWLSRTDQAALEKVSDPVLRNHAGLVVGELNVRI